MKLTFNIPCVDLKTKALTNNLRDNEETQQENQGHNLPLNNEYNQQKHHQHKWSEVHRWKYRDLVKEESTSEHAKDDFDSEYLFNDKKATK